jgi:2-keto-4-pentenoate hydratase
MRARREGRTLAAPQGAEQFSLEQAYAVQEQVTVLRVASGERVVGWKLGYTSRAMREQMGVDAPNYGPLTDAMLLEDGATVPAAALQPRVEPEIAVVFGESVTDLFGSQRGGPGPERTSPSRERVAAAVVEVRAAIEVVDSVWTGYRFRLEDNTADGSSAAWVVLGPAMPVDPLTVDRVTVRMIAHGEEPVSGVGADADGHPLDGVARLIERLRRGERRLEPGDVVITGGLTRATPLDRAVRAEFEVPAGGRTTVAVLPPER